MTSRSIYFGNNTSQGKITYNVDTGNFTLGNNSEELLHINANKNVGIGFTTNETPNYRLDISGGVINTDTTYNINGNVVINETGLGNTIVNSSLTNLGTLTSLNVNGDTNISGSLNLDENTGLYVNKNADINILNVNTVNITGNASVESIDIINDTNLNGDLNVTGTLAVNTDILYVDPTNGRVGINNSLPLSALDVKGNAEISGDIVIQGNITVNGSSLAINTENLTIEDPLIYLARENATDSVDIGFYGSYVEDSINKYTGFFRDSSDGIFKLFNNLQTTPTSIISGTYDLGTILVGQMKTDTIDATTNIQTTILDVSDNATFNTITTSSTANLNNVIVSGSITTDTINVSNILNVNGDTNINNFYSVLSTGYIGIGIENPSELLDVNGSMCILNNILPKTTNISNLGSSTKLFNKLYLSENGINLNNATITSSGTDIIFSNNINVGNSIYIDSSTSKIGIGVLTPLYAIDMIGDINMTGNIYQNGNLIESLWKSNLNGDIYNTNINNVGFGVQSPLYKVDVLGDINLTGSFKINASDILSETTLGSSVTNSSLTKVGILSELYVNNDANLTLGNSYKINNTIVLNETTLGSSVVNSSLTSVGSLTSLDMVGNINMNLNTITNASSITSTNIYGTLQTTSQPNITSVGSLTNLDMTGDINMNLNTITNASSITSTNIYGTLQTTSQPNITSVGSLTNLDMTGNLTVNTDTFIVDTVNKNIGIGIATPDSRLHIIDDTDHQADETGVHAIKISTGVSGQTSMIGYDGVEDITYINSRNTTTTTGLILQSNGGNVGVGITNPTYTLDILGDINFTGSIYNNGNIFESNNYTFGIANTNAVAVDDLSILSGDFAIFTTNGLEGKSISEVKTDLSLNNVENTALSTYVNNLTEDITPDTATDYIMTYDASSGSQKKVLLNNLGLSGGSGNSIEDTDATTSITTEEESETIIFKTSSSEQMRLDIFGNLGLGTNTAARRFHAVGTDSGRNFDSLYSKTNFIMEDSTDCILMLTGGNVNQCELWFSDADNTAGPQGRVRYEHTLDKMEFWTANAERMNIDSSGNVGIGTATPTEKLEINTIGNATESNLLLLSDTNVDTNLQFRESTVNTGFDLRYDATNDQFAIISKTPTEVKNMVINRDNKTIGFGTDSTISIANNTTVGIFDGDDSHLYLTTDLSNPSLVFQTFSANNSNIGFDCYWNGGFKSTHDGSNFMIRKNGNALRFLYDSGVTAGEVISLTDGMVMNSIGDVGIGNSNPSYKLDVNGDINFTGDIRQNGSTISLTRCFARINLTGGPESDGDNAGLTGTQALFLNFTRTTVGSEYVYNQNYDFNVGFDSQSVTLPSTGTSPTQMQYIVASNTGYYRISYSILINNTTSTGQFQAYIRVNNSGTYGRCSINKISNSINESLNGSEIVYMTAGQYAQIYIVGTGTYGCNSSENYVSIELVS